jgi:hypothetical protein
MNRCKEAGIPQPQLRELSSEDIPNTNCRCGVFYKTPLVLTFPWTIHTTWKGANPVSTILFFLDDTN